MFARATVAEAPTQISVEERTKKFFHKKRHDSNADADKEGKVEKTEDQVCHKIKEEEEGSISGRARNVEERKGDEKWELFSQKYPIQDK